MKRVIKSLDEDIAIINGCLHINKRPEYDKRFLTFKNKIKNVNSEKINDVVLHVFNHNKNVLYVGFAFYTDTKVLEILATRKLKMIDDQSIVTVQKESKKYNVIERLLQTATFIECKSEDESNDYISVYDVVKIKEYLNSNYNELKEFISFLEEAITRRCNVKNVRICYNDFLCKKSNAIDIKFVDKYNKTEEKGQITIDSFGKNMDGCLSNFLYWVEIKYIIELIDKLREYVINNKLLKLKIVNFDGSLILNENGIVLTDNKTFSVDKKHDSDIKVFSNHYKNFSLMEENLQRLLRNSFVKLSDCPKYILNEIEAAKPKSNDIKCMCRKYGFVVDGWK